MTMCYFGIYNPNYSRNRILIRGLRQNKIKVVECNTRVKGIAKYFDLIKKHWKIRKDYDLMIVGFPGWQSVILAKILTSRPVVFDAYLSIYNVIVFDRKICSPKSLRAGYFWILDWLAGRLADRILLDTNAHIEYFVENFGIKKEKFIRALIGADDTVFKPLGKQGSGRKSDEFIIGFHGNFIPVQGVRYIIKAAEILRGHRDILFVFIGDGQEFNKIERLVKNLSLDNVKFLGRVPYEEMPRHIAGFDVGLGNFGNTPKTPLVIANKTYEINAMGIAHISADAVAMREIYTDKKNILFCSPADGEDLAEKILILKNNSGLRGRIARGGQELFKRVATPKIIAKQLLNDL